MTDDPPEEQALAPQRPIPRATYRLQLHQGFGFRDASRILPYLAALGISHVYCSPYLRATPGSMHGYDVVDPCTINPDLGDAQDFDHFNRQLRARGLTQLLDIVPNHMGVESEENAWWQDVLRNGSASPYARYFDIDWSGRNGVPAGRLLLPVLGGPLDQVIAERQLVLRREPDCSRFRLHYFERSLPVNARGTALIFGTAAGNPAGTDEDLARALEDPALVAAVAGCQHYQLAPWQEAASRINYRRFFDVSGLAALRIEDPVVFEATHRLVIELVRAGIVSGLRIDHPDGLRDPAAYFRRLQAAVSPDPDQARTHAGVGQPHGRQLYLVAEKILAEGEELPSQWPVSGTTGYDFANLACGVLLDGDTADRIDRIWRDFTGETAGHFADMAYQAKKEVLASSFGSEMRTLTHGFEALLPRSLRRPGIQQAVGDLLAEVVACFPVYRTYPGPTATEAARRFVRQACSEAGRRLDRNPQAGDRLQHDGQPLHHALLAALEALLTGPVGDPEGTAAVARRRGEWAVRFQQLCAPVMAKGVEDTALYRWTRLVSINDVGADPDVTGVTVQHFHHANIRRLETWPHAMLATSTHDNKRGEYVRMRINLISEDPEQWQDIALGWRETAERLMAQAGMTRRPSASDLYLLFQTFIGTFPVEWPAPAGLPGGTSAASAGSGAAALRDYGDRVKAYMTKACREAKRHTAWTAPDEAYEAAVHGLVDAMLQDEACRARLAQDVRPFAWYGALNSLSLTALKLTVPGVPDIYQGARILDDSLVDPDNRRPVDFAQRQVLIEELAATAGEPAAAIRRALAGWLAAGEFARLKLWIIHRLLHWRALHPQLFESGRYVPVPLKGPRARHCIAFARRNERHGILVIAARLYHQLHFPGPDGSHGSEGNAGGRNVWQNTAVDLAAAGIRARDFVDLLSNPSQPAGEAAATALDPPAEPATAPPSLQLDRLLAVLPLAVLSFDVERP